MNIIVPALIQQVAQTNQPSWWPSHPRNWQEIQVFLTISAKFFVDTSNEKLQEHITGQKVAHNELSLTSDLQKADPVMQFFHIKFRKHIFQLEIFVVKLKNVFHKSRNALQSSVRVAIGES